MSKPVYFEETFKQYVKCGGYTDSTIDSKMRAAGLFCKFLGNMALNDVTYGHCEDYQNMLRQGGRAAKTVNLYVIHMRHFFDWANKRKYLNDNPFAEVNRLPEEVRMQQVFGADELVRLINVAPVRWKVLVCFGLLGLREGEALNLHRQDLHFDAGHILLTAKKGDKDSWPWGIKNRKEAYAPLPEVLTLPDMVIPLRSLVEKLLVDIPATQPYVCIVPAYYEKVITCHREGRLHYRKRMTPWGNFDRDLKALQKKAWIAPPKSFHDLRRTFADRLRKEGYDLRDVQALMRHSSITTTANYYLTVQEKELVTRANRTFSDYRTSVL